MEEQEMLGEHQQVPARVSRSGLVLFDPQKTVQEIVMLRSLEDWAASLGDYEACRKAVEERLTKQREFVLWWDTSGERGKGNQYVLSNRTVREQLNDFGLSEMTVSRWRTRLTKNGEPDDTLLIKAMADHLRKVIKTLDMEQAANYSSESVEWYTPSVYIEAARESMGGIDLDPASCAKANETVKAEMYWTAEDNALSRQWHGRVWLNPPYGKKDGDSLAAAFCNKAISEYEARNVEAAILLVNSVHSQKWQAPLYRYQVCLVDHRIQFVSGDGEKNDNPTFQNLIVHLGTDRKAFYEAFSSLGYVMVPYKP